MKSWATIEPKTLHYYWICYVVLFRFTQFQVSEFTGHQGPTKSNQPHNISSGLNRLKFQNVEILTKLNTQNIYKEEVISNEEKKKLILHWAGSSFDIENRDWYKYSCRVGKLVHFWFNMSVKYYKILMDFIFKS